MNSPEDINRDNNMIDIDYLHVKLTVKEPQS